MQIKNSADAQSFAGYLARQYIAKKGFRAGTVPEAEGLVAASDIVLTLSDGVRFHIICMVDREAHPDKRFMLSRDEIDEIGKSCLKYSGTINRAKMPIVIQIMEVGKARLVGSDRDRLKRLKRRSPISKVVISSWHIDTSSASVWSNSLFNGLLTGRHFIERLLRAPRASDAELQPRPAALVPPRRWPILTAALIAALVAAFVGEQVYGIGPTTGLWAPSIRTLVALGGLSPALVFESGEWFRIFSAVFLHGDFLHLLMNGIALAFAGYVLESLVGRAWLFALFVIGAIGGSLMSLAVNPSNMVSVGASGAIMGLLAGAYVCSFRYPSGIGRTHMQMNLLRILIPSLIPIATRSTGHHIDFGAHLGGALSGLLVGAVILKTWSETSISPRFVKLAGAVAVAGLAAFLVTLVPITNQYRTYVLGAMMIPKDQMPKSDEEVKSRSADLVAHYPRDPRAHLFRAATLLSTQDSVGAERELRAGLDDRESLGQFSPELELRLRTTLALVLSDKGQLTEAKTTALPVCTSTATSMRDALNKAQLCE